MSDPFTIVELFTHSTESIMQNRLLPRIGAAIVIGALPLFLTVSASGQPNPIAAEVKSQLKDPAKPFTLILRIQVKDGMQAKFEAAFATARKVTLKEKGCIAYDLNHDGKDSTQYLVYERWKNLADLEAHIAAPHITSLLAELKELLAGPPDAKVMVPAGE